MAPPPPDGKPMNMKKSNFKLEEDVLLGAAAFYSYEYGEIRQTSVVLVISMSQSDLQWL